ncbi:MAG: hypothetical protein ACK5TH_01615 [Prosthecobacter sp.]|jgi:hypothetical protein
MSHLICLLARAGGFATRWDELFLAEVGSDGQSVKMGTPLPSNDGKLDRTVTQLPSNDGKLDRTVTPLSSIDRQSHRTVTPLPSNDRQSDRTVTRLPSIDRQSHRTVTPLPSFYRILESFGEVLASKTPFWHLYTLNRPENHARPTI